MFKNVQLRAVFALMALASGLPISQSFAGTIQLSDGPRVKSIEKAGDRVRLCIERADGSCTFVGPEEGFERSRLKQEERKLTAYAVVGTTAAAGAIILGTTIAVCTLGEVAAAAVPLTRATCRVAKEGALISALAYAEAATVLAFNKISPITFWRHAGEMRDVLSDPEHFVISDRTEKQYVADLQAVLGKDLKLEHRDAAASAR